MKFKKLVTLFTISSMFFVALPKTTYSDTINLKNINSNEKVSYKINGKQIKSKYPGIIINGISLASAKEIFSDSPIGLSYKYKNKNIIFKGKGKKLVLKLNSNSAKLDGVNVTAPLAPRIIEFSKNIKKIYVPARFIAQSFDFTYNWDKSSGVASLAGKTIKKKVKKSKKPKKVLKKKVASKKPSKNIKVKDLNTFKYRGKIYSAKKKVIFTLGGNKLNSSKLPGLYVNKTLFAPAKAIFTSKDIDLNYKYNKSRKSMRLGFDGDFLNLKLKSRTAYFNKTKIKLEDAPDLVKLNFTNKSEVYLPIDEILDIFDIGLKTKGLNSELILPEDDEDDEDVGEITSSNDIENKDTEKDDTVSENPENNTSTKTNNNTNHQQTTETNLPFTWTSKSHVNLSIFNPVQTIEGSPSLTGSKLINITPKTTSAFENCEIYEISSTLGFSSVTGNFSENKLDIKCENLIVENPQFNISSKTVSSVSFESIERASQFTFNLTKGILGYEMFLSQDNKILILKIYKNTITEITGTNTGDVYNFTFMGVNPLEVKSTNVSENEIKFTFENVIDTIGSTHYKGNNISLNYTSNGSVEATIFKPAGYSYYVQESGNSTNVVVLKKESLSGSTKIKLPDGVDLSQITDEDNYFNHNFTLTIPGDLREHFNNSPIIYDSEKVKNVTVDLVNGNTVLTFYTTQLYAYKLHKTTNQITIDIDSAKNLYSKVVVVDPGHGAHDNGTSSFDGIYKEKNIALAIGYTYFKNYLRDDDLKVYWTRKGDTFMKLIDRARFPEKVGADLFVSVHLNAFTRASANGTEVWYSTRNNQIQSNGLSSYAMAGMFLKSITSTFNTRNRGVKSTTFVVTNMNTVPAVLLEYGFLTNGKDLGKFKQLKNQDKAAEELYNTIQNIFATYPTGRKALASRSSSSNIKVMSTKQHNTQVASNTTNETKPEYQNSKSKKVEKLPNIEAYKEMRAAWITFLEFSDKGYTKDTFTSQINKMFDYIKESGLNTIYAHVRPFSDAFYKSTYFPWSKYVSGTQGLDPGFDPLEIMVSEAHKRGLKLHAYINPYRVCTTKDFKKISTDSPAYKWWNDEDYKRNVLKYNGMYYYNPSSDEVIKLINNGVKEIIDNYAVDGIIFDDYFYPNLGKKYKKNFDAPEYSDYVDECDDEPMSIVAWRRNNINKMVKRVYSTIKNKNKTLLFGISPAGNISNLLDKNRYYVDIYKWCSEDGFLDYVAPQQYWGFEHETCSFEGNVNKWRNIVTNPNIKLYFVLPIHLAQAQNTEEWQENHDIISRMITSLREKSLGGFSIYRYDYMTPDYLKKDGALEEYENMVDTIDELD